MSSDFDLAQAEAQAVSRLQTARRDFDVVKREEEKYLKDRESKAQALVARIVSRGESAQTFLEAVISKIAKRTTEYKAKCAEFTRGLFSALNRVDKILDITNRIMDKGQQTLDVCGSTLEAVDAHITKLLTLEKEIEKREREVMRREKEADRKLKKAVDIADWVRSGKRYNSKDLS